MWKWASGSIFGILRHICVCCVVWTLGNSITWGARTASHRRRRRPWHSSLSNPKRLRPPGFRRLRFRRLGVGFSHKGLINPLAFWCCRHGRHARAGHGGEVHQAKACRSLTAALGTTKSGEQLKQAVSFRARHRISHGAAPCDLSAAPQSVQREALEARGRPCWVGRPSCIPVLEALDVPFSLVWLPWISVGYTLNAHYIPRTLPYQSRCIPKTY